MNCGLPETATAGDIRVGALLALRVTTVDERLRLTLLLAGRPLACDTAKALGDPGDVPGRPERPLLVPPGAVPQRSVGTHDGRAALLHALAHIEFNAIGLALDHTWRFAGLPEQYYRDWIGVAIEEARHFALLRARLLDAGFDYGDFPAHDGLWEMARRTSDDVLARMAIVPRTLEARGLDASPAVRAKFAAVGDLSSAGVIDRILDDEIGHVAIGNRWFRYLCRQRGIEPAAAAREAAERCNAPRQRGPLNIAARILAGFTESELDELQRSQG
jgi:uncharacterized ferritin-like protein (DUF455 family)